MTPDISSDPQRAQQRLHWARTALGDATATLERASVDAGFRSYWRTQGVGGVNVFGSGYAMRVWLDPLRLAQFQLTPTDITTAVAQQKDAARADATEQERWQVTATQQLSSNIPAQRRRLRMGLGRLHRRQGDEIHAHARGQGQFLGVMAGRRQPLPG